MSQEVKQIRIQSRVDTKENWIKENPTLLNKEIGYERETGKYKIGDGNSKWNDLKFASTEDNSNKEDKANKVNSTNSEYWLEHQNDIEGYPNMSTVSKGMIHMQSNQIDPLKEQVNELSGIIKGANYARSFETYEALIDHYDSLDNPHTVNNIISAAEYYTPIGNSMYIKTLNVPDLWVMKRLCDEENVVYPFTPICNDIKADAQAAGMPTLDEYIIDQLNQYGEFSIKWLTFAPLETQKVNLTDYYTKAEVNAITINSINSILEGEY